MMTHNLLRLFHIVGGILWVGFAVFVAMFLIPTLESLGGPAGGAVMREIAGKQKLPRYMMAISWLTILTGAALMWRDASPIGASWFRQGMGLWLGIGAALAVIAALIGMVVSAPAASRIRSLAVEAERTGTLSPADQSRIDTLQARLNRASTQAAVLLFGAAMAMAYARYA